MKTQSENSRSAPPSLVRRKLPRQRRSEMTVRSILDATLKVAAVEGFRNLSSAEIARKAGVSVGSLYQYFPTVEAILLAVYEEAAGRVNTKFRSKMLDCMHAPMEVAGRKTLQLLLDEYESNELVLHQLPLEVPQLMIAPGTASLERLVGADIRLYLLQFRQLTEQDVEGAVFFLEGMIVGSMRNYLVRRPRMTRKAFIDDLVSMTAGFMWLRHGNLRDPDDRTPPARATAKASRSIKR